MISFYRSSPGFRAGLRSVVVGVIAYFVAAMAQGGAIDDWSSFGWGLAGAVANLLVGILTPTEPFIGVKATVEVPSPPAVPERP